MTQNEQHNGSARALYVLVHFSAVLWITVSDEALNGLDTELCSFDGKQNRQCLLLQTIACKARDEV